MSLSQQLLTFVAVGIGYVVFTFAWGWYVGREGGDDGTEPPEPESPPNQENPGGEV